VVPVKTCAKTPLTRHGFKDASTDERRVREWWEKWPDANVGVVTGEPSGLIVLDLDRKGAHDGVEIARSRFDFEPEGYPHVRTGGGGIHVLFKWPGSPVGNRTGTGSLAPCVEVKGDGGYIVAPPSIHESGRRYEWVQPPDGDLPELPSWVLEGQSRRAQPRQTQPEGLASLDPLEAARTKGVPEGQRNDTAARLAGRYFHKGLGADDVLCILRGWNEKNHPPLPPDELREVVESIGRLQRLKQGETVAKGAPDLSDAELLDLAFCAKNGAKIKTLWDGDTSSYASPREADLALVRHLAFYTGPDLDRLDRLFRKSKLCREKWTARPDYRKMTIETALEGMTEFYGKNAGVGGDGLTIIEVANQQLRQKTDKALAALERANDPPDILQRSGKLVRIRKVPDEDGRLRPVIETLDDPGLTGFLTRAANFVRSGRQGRAGVDPPQAVVRDILSLGRWRFPTVLATTEVPVLRADGSLLLERGYDRATRLVYVPQSGLEIPDIPQEPTKSDIRTSREVVLELLQDFPFEGASARANAIGLLLTPVVRPMIRGCVPLCIIDGTKPGSGKTLLADSVAVVATGRPGAVMSVPSDDAEWGKRITTMVMEGRTFVVVDNVAQTLRAAPLCVVLTCSRWSGRVLGKSVGVDLPHHATWVATGNNIQVSGDVPRRSYWIRMDPKHSKPWKRSGFVHSPLLPWVQENRGRIITALLTLARAWIVAGRTEPPGLPIFGSFESWTNVVGGILHTAGVEGFLSNLDEFHDRQSTDEVEWAALLGKWHELIGEQPVTVGQLCNTFGLGKEGLNIDAHAIAMLMPTELLDAYAGRPLTFAKRFGWALKKHEKERFGEDEFYVERVGDDRTGATWRARRAKR